MNLYYYFTGTGNTLHAARRMAELLGDTQIRRITADTVSEDLSKYERIGFFSPTYNDCAPVMVQEFVKKLNIGNDTYVFTAVTCGGAQLATHSELRRILKKKKIRTAASFTFYYPSNNQTRYAPVSAASAEKANTANEKRLRNAVEVVKSEGKNLCLSKPVSGLISQSISDKIIPPESDKKFSVSDACVECGICARVCPAANIEIKEEHPVWKQKCTRCTACLQLCPQRAIDYGNASKSWGRYRNPDISLKELFVK